MKKKIKAIYTLILCLVFSTTLTAQNNASKEFDELWEKATKGNGTAKSLNQIELEKMNVIDITKPNIINPNFKKIDTTNIEIFSTKPIIKGVSTPSYTPVDTPFLVKEIIKDEIPVTKSTSTKTPTAEKSATKLNSTSVNKIPSTKNVSSKEPEKMEDFSSRPIVNGKPIPVKNTEIDKTPKYEIDDSKNFKDFTFETKPIIGNNASYSRKYEPLPKSKQQEQDEIQVNRKSNNTNVDKDNSFLKAAYAQYDKEADSLHTVNKMRLDSIMKSLNIKVPVVINPNDYIDIFVNGGGLLTDNNAKLYDRISILHTGVVQREYKSKNEGLQRTEKKISRDELTKLAQYIVDMDFFEFNEDYDCQDDDNECNGRFSKFPQPVPMDITVTIGQRKNKVGVSIFAPRTEKNWVNYPSNLEKIMNAIYAIVEK